MQVKSGTAHPQIKLKQLISKIINTKKLIAIVSKEKLTNPNKRTLPPQAPFLRASLQDLQRLSKEVHTEIR